MEKIEITLCKICSNQFAFLKDDVAKFGIGENGEAYFAMIEGTIHERRPCEIYGIESTGNKSTIGKRGGAERISLILDAFKGLVYILRLGQDIHRE